MGVHIKKEACPTTLVRKGNEIIAGNDRERLMVAIKFSKNIFYLFYVLLKFPFK